MVEKKFDNTVVRLTKTTYSIKTKVSGYISGDNVDRENMKAFILPETRIVFSVEINNYADGDRLFSTDLDSKSLLTVDDISLDKLYEVINNFTKKTNACAVLLDGGYNIFAYSFGKDNYIPYEIDKLEKTELTVMTVSPLVDEINKEKESYFIFVLGDLIKIVDFYTIHNLIFLLIKYYVENRFPARDKERMKDCRIISLQGFSFLFYHIKSLLHAKEIYKETIKTGYDTMSKMNLLPHIPSEIWYVEENFKNLKVDRLKSFKHKKHSIFERVLKSNKITIPTPKTEYIPTYYTHLFDENSPVIGWKEFCENIRDMDWGVESLTPNIWATETDDAVFSIIPCIIIPDESIVDLLPSNITFMGFDGDELHLVIKSKILSEKETTEEASMRERIGRHLLIKLGLETTITFDTYYLAQKHLDLLEEGV